MNRLRAKHQTRPLSDLKQQAPRHDERLQRVLERERARVDRSGGAISLVVFFFDRPVRWPSRKMRRLLAALDARARITDEVGRIDRARAFVLLPDTRPEGGRRFAEDVVGMLARCHTKVDFAVFRYASARPTTSDHHDDHSRGAIPRRSLANEMVLRSQTTDPPLLRTDNEPTDCAQTDTAGATAGDQAECLVQNFSPGLPWWKRSMDITVAAAALVCCLPLFAVVAVAIKLDSPGPIFFKQMRTGHSRTRFKIYKFRTMVTNAERLRGTLLDQNEHDGPAFKIRNDPRITRVGALLRKTSIDEFPQFINVLLGDMTIVGPRPLPCNEADACQSWQDRRHTVHPGLTCIWQVRGRSRVSFEEWARMDLAYARRVSLWNDVKIMAMTVPAVLRQDGAQ